MKYLLQLSLAAMVVVLLTPSNATAQFHTGGQWVGAHIVVATTPVGFGANYEYAINENMGVGGILRYWGRSFDYVGGELSWTVIMPEAVFNYHFQPREQIDPFVGARLGYAIYDYDWETEDAYINPYSSTVENSLFLTIAGGARYFFSKDWSAHGELEVQIAGEDYFDSGIQIHLGVDYTLP